MLFYEVLWAPKRNRPKEAERYFWQIILDRCLSFYTYSYVDLEDTGQKKSSFTQEIIYLSGKTGMNGNVAANVH